MPYVLPGWLYRDFDHLNTVRIHATYYCTDTLFGPFENYRILIFNYYDKYIINGRQNISI